MENFFPHHGKPAALAVAAVLLAGCASPYWADRGRDAADIFTLTAATGAGAGLRAGPLAAGLGSTADRAGLRGGRFGPLDAQQPEALDVKLLFFGFEWLARKSDPRGKNYTATTGLIVTGPPEQQRQFYVPFVSLPVRGDPTTPRLQRAALANCEIHVAAGVGVRAGFNPGEALDFLLGWFGFDLFADDLGRRVAVP